MFSTKFAVYVTVFAKNSQFIKLPLIIIQYVITAKYLVPMPATRAFVLGVKENDVMSGYE